MTESLSSSIKLSNLQRQVLEVIVLKGTSIQGQAWREQIVLLWEQGMSAAETAEELKVDVSLVSQLRQKWFSSAERLTIAEEKVHEALVDLISEVTQILDSGQVQPRSTPTPTVAVARKR